MKAFLFIFILLVASSAYAVEVDEEWLREVRELIEEQDAHIQRLTDKVVEQQEEILTLRAERDEWKASAQNQRGVYYGGAVGYPLSASGMLMYKFDRWGVYAAPGYSNGFYIQGGLFFKMR